MTATTRSQAKKHEDQEPDAHAHAGSKHTKPSSPPAAPEPDTKRPKKDEKGASKSECKSKSKSESDSSVPSSILEKGIIYFFFRGRVNVDEPSAVDDIARSFILLRPVDHDTGHLGSGPIGNTAEKARLLAIPKKVLPRTGRDRWIAFVEKAGASSAQLRDEFLSSTDYVTKTVGSRHSPAATPVGEGVYAITSTDGTSHLAYILTIPKELGEVQHEMGIQERGSFIISTKNPKYPGTANSRLPKGAEYPDEVLQEFGSRRWIPTQPAHLDYGSTQILLIGESSGLRKALELQKEDRKDGAEEPADEMEKLEEEDAERMKGLSEDDSGRIFADLEVRAKDYPKLQTEF